ncbi:MerR family transcriptional regulator [Luteimonas sp. MC1782]|uniref:MerR family transcriptional regulator n=1 Tax=Luteimonas sp. MC1782 TaxID=2760305 RepID=UPI001600495F|nr:MerR family transcriptional regulator [Luteimonas sp. MC1782]MBB1472204.1 MerR family transcriptional regulator [Luteimonas sp. MC1782]
MFPVKAAAELSGLTPETLRAWERRHAAVVPHRDDKGRRLYDSAMVERLARLHRLTDRGHPIRDLAALADDALDRLLEEGRHTAYGGVEALPERMLDAIAEYQVDVFDRDLAVAITTLPLPVLMARVVTPLLREVGVRWADGRLAIAQERLVSSLLRARLLSVLNQQARGSRPRVLFATLPGERHELGLIGAALHAYEAGAPVLYLGTELPARELARVAERLGAAAVAISSVDPAQARSALQDLQLLHEVLPPGVAVCVGGANARYLVEALGIARVRAVSDATELARHAA